MFIDFNTISTIQALENGRARLRFYDCNKNIVFEKIYKSFKSARIAEGILMKKYAW